MKEKDHVVYILTKLELGGAQKVCLSLMEDLKKQKVKVSLISGSEGVLIDTVKKNFDSIFLLSSFKHSVSFFNFFGEIKNFFTIVNILKTLKKKYPHLIVHTHSTKAGIVGRWAAFFAGVSKRIHTIHGWGFNNYQSWPRWLTIWFFEFITSFITSTYICVSHKDLQEGSRLIPLFNAKSTLIRAAVDWNKFYIPEYKAINKSQQNSFVVGTVACFKPQKNLFDLLQAFSHAHKSLSLRGKTISLQIIGDGAQREKIENWIKQHDLQNSIVLLGWQQNIASIIRTWDIFALSSLWEGLPCSIIEARLSKIPVVAYDVGGISEIIQSDINGFIIPPGNWMHLSQTIISLATDESLYKRIAFFDDCLSDFNNNVMVEKHAALYQLPYKQHDEKSHF